MSLFPAYDQTNLEDNQSPGTNWLTNSSFPSISVNDTVLSDSSDCEIIQNVAEVIKPKSSRKHKKSKKHSKSSKHQVQDYEPVVENVYFDDKFRDKGNFRVDTLTSRVRPLYHSSNKSLGVPALLGKKKKCKRYFLVNHAVNNTIQVDERKSEQIKQFNQRLTEEPHNIDLWLEYINFNYENETTKTQRMLSIVEKALDLNSSSKKLLQIKLELISELVPADQLSLQIETQISKDPGNVTLWQALIAIIQTSVAMCTVPRVLKLHSKCFGSLHLWPRTCKESYDQHLLTMLYHCLIFLRHTGLWEQMWEVIRYNLNLNLGISKDLQNLTKWSIDEKKLIEMEEVILTSRLPLNQLWLRVELLRENSHWMSISREQLELVGDSHRFITPEDVTEFVHPVLTRNSNLKMAVYCILALKVPLLPSRHMALKDLGIDENNWSFDSLESLLPMIYPCSGEMAGHLERSRISHGLVEGALTSGPQYLSYHPAQEPYLEFVRDAFRTIAEGLTSQHRTSIYIWWLRFERTLVSVQNSLKVDNKSFKRLKGILKEFLKKDENRNDLHYYREYALIERELGRLSNCVNILETAIQSKAIDTIDGDEQAAVMSLYRTLLEVMLDSRCWMSKYTVHDVIKVFCHMNGGQSDEERLTLTEKYLGNCYKAFVEDCDESRQTDLNFDNQFMLPIFSCDAVACYVYLLYIKDHETAEIIEVFDRCLEKSTKNSYLQEQFYESKIKLLQLVCEKQKKLSGILRSNVHEALKIFPNNFYILSVSAGIESDLPLWNVSTQSESNQLWPNIALCLAGRARLHSAVCANDSAALTAALNKLLNLHQKLSRSSKGRNCPLLWRLYMLLIREHNLCEKRGEEIYHESVAQCPWARCIYIDAAQVAPQILTQIQDVIREKELRMHITPEELDILRGS